MRFETVYQTHEAYCLRPDQSNEGGYIYPRGSLRKIGKWLHVMSRHMTDYIDNLACVQIIPLRVTVFYYAWSH